MSPRRLIASALVGIACAWTPRWALAVDCSGSVAPPIPDMYVAAPEMRAALVAPPLDCTLAQEVIDRARADARAAMNTTSAPVSGGGASAAAYVPKTQFDNTPWRFDMNQNGKRMTAAEFDAWMKAKGIHVATGKPATAVTDTAAVAAAAASAVDASAPASGATTP